MNGTRLVIKNGPSCLLNNNEAIKMKKDNSANYLGDVMNVYIRAQAVEDGFLVDVSSTAYEAGFTIPVAVTYAVWNAYIEWTDRDTECQTSQDTEGRLWDVLSMLRFAIARSHASCVYYKLYVVPRNGKAEKAKLTQLKAIISAGDKGEPVITIMLPNED